MKMTFGSVCSGIEAAHFAFSPYGIKQVWSSEIAEFPRKVLDHHFPDIKNVGDMLCLPELILEEKYVAPDLLCGGTPCQAFSLAGWKNGLQDERGQLTMKFIEIADAIDIIRNKQKKTSAIVLWENVEGVLNDKTNAFGNFLAGLAGYDEEIKVKKWSKSGVVFGKTRNIAWRVIDAKHFGVPQQRKRLYVLAGGKDFRPDKILFEISETVPKANIKSFIPPKKSSIESLFPESTQSDLPYSDEDKIIYKDGNRFEFFRSYTDCLYAAYGTKWNGNAAAYNGSLYVSQNNRLRRLTPLECERLMGFPDNYTLIKGSSDTNRYQAVGNSWAIPVVKWLGRRISNYLSSDDNKYIKWDKVIIDKKKVMDFNVILLSDNVIIEDKKYLNSSSIPNTQLKGHLSDIVQTENIPEKFYLSPQACKGILRRKDEKNIKMNKELERIMSMTSSELFEKFKVC